MDRYEDFLKTKQITCNQTGITKKYPLNSSLFDFQRDVTYWALRLGKACVFAGCGLGKTFMSLEWCRVVHKHTRKPLLIAAPLAVAQQTVKEGEKFNVPVHYDRKGGRPKHRITITNYEMLKNFDMRRYIGVVVDESSILKDFASKTRNEIIDNMINVRFKLACTATPSPNDLMEIGNHAEFMGVMTRSEMLSMFFVHDGGETSKWRLKKHAQKDFYAWMSTWCVMFRRPSDIGYEDNKFNLPPLHFHKHVVKCGKPERGHLIVTSAKTLPERQTARKKSIKERCKRAALHINKTGGVWLIFCDRNDESRLLKKLIVNSVEVKGSDTLEHKINSMVGFSKGTVEKLISKPSICGHGMNWQHCHNIAFIGLSDSFEMFYQALRRVWRFGQDKEVYCHIYISNTEGAVLKNIKRKEMLAEKIQSEIIKHMKVSEIENLHGTSRTVATYMPQDTIKLPEWILK